MCSSAHILYWSCRRHHGWPCRTESTPCRPKDPTARLHRGWGRCRYTSYPSKQGEWRSSTSRRDPGLFLLRYFRVRQINSRKRKMKKMVRTVGMIKPAESLCGVPQLYRPRDSKHVLFGSSQRRISRLLRLCTKASCVECKLSYSSEIHDK